MRADPRSRRKGCAKSSRGCVASRAGNEGAAPFGGNLDADQRALQRNIGAVPINIWIVRGQPLFGARQRFLGPLQIDLFRALSRFRKNGDTVRKNLGKSANDSDMTGLLTAPVVIA